MNNCRAFKATTFTQTPTISDNLVTIPVEPRQLLLQMKRPVFLSRKIFKKGGKGLPTQLRRKEIMAV